MSGLPVKSNMQKSAIDDPLAVLGPADEMVRQEFLEIRSPLPRTVGSDDEIGIGIEIAIGKPTIATGIVAIFDVAVPEVIEACEDSRETQPSIEVIVDADSHDVAIEMHARGRCDGSGTGSG